MYWREYRTEFHVGLTYGVSEATVCRTIKKIEDVLIKSKQFHLPGKKVLQSSSLSESIELLQPKAKIRGELATISFHGRPIVRFALETVPLF